MKSRVMPKARKGGAETAFRAAFERLKQGSPWRIPNGSRISQNNVAREAGVEPSTFRKDRYPDLAEEVMQWIKVHQKLPTKNSTNRPLTQRTKGA